MRETQIQFVFKWPWIISKSYFHPFSLHHNGISYPREQTKLSSLATCVDFLTENWVEFMYRKALVRFLIIDSWWKRSNGSGRAAGRMVPKHGNHSCLGAQTSLAPLPQGDDPPTFWERAGETEQRERVGESAESPSDGGLLMGRGVCPNHLSP